jgi:hypothetical protein
MANLQNSRACGIGLLLLMLISFGSAAADTASDCTDIQRALVASGVAVPGACGRPVDTKVLSGGCPNPAVAKEYLKTRTGNPASIEGLNPEFACNLMKLLQAAPGGGITISVGVYQVTATVATKGVAYCQHYQCQEGTNSHPRGLAADLLYNGTKGPGGNGASAWCHQNALCSWAHQNAASFGLMFRLMPESGCAAGYYEPWHVEIKGVAGCQGTDGFGGALSAAAAPLAIGNAVRSLFGGQQPASPAPLPAQQMALSQSPISAFGGDATPSESTVSGVSSQLGSTDTDIPRTSSTADTLEQLAFGNPPAASSMHATSVPLVVSGSNAIGITDTQDSQAQSVSAGNVTAPSQQTFTSGDLSWQTGNMPEAPLSGIEATLAMIKQVLLKLLPYLTPFGVHPRPEE